MEHSILSWLLFLCVFLGLILSDLGITKYTNFDHRKYKVAFSIFYIILALVFGCFIYLFVDKDLGSQYFVGFLVEKTLSVDNIFIIYAIFKYFAIEKRYQHKILFIGIVSALVLRAILIFVGSALVTQFEALIYLFGVILIITGLKMLFFSNTKFDIERSFALKALRKRFSISASQTRFFIIENKRLQITTLFLALVMVELADLIFAVDSIPAIFMITNDTYVIYTSNMFAVLGLRSLYFVVSDAVKKFQYLEHSLGVLLAFIGTKPFLKHYVHISNGTLLAITVAILGIGLIASMLAKGLHAPKN